MPRHCRHCVYVGLIKRFGYLARGQARYVVTRYARYGKKCDGRNQKRRMPHVVDWNAMITVIGQRIHRLLYRLSSWKKERKEESLMQRENQRREIFFDFEERTNRSDALRPTLILDESAFFGSDYYFRANWKAFKLCRSLGDSDSSSVLVLPFGSINRELMISLLDETWRPVEIGKNAECSRRKFDVRASRIFPQVCSCRMHHWSLPFSSFLSLIRSYIRSVDTL